MSARRDRQRSPVFGGAHRPPAPIAAELRPRWSMLPPVTLDTVYAALRGSGRVFLRPQPYREDDREAAKYVDDGPVVARCVDPGCTCLDRAGVTYASRAEVPRGYEIVEIGDEW